MKVLITDGHERPALAIARSLGQRGMEVLVGSEHRSSLASASKYCARHVTYPSPYRAPNFFDQLLIALVELEHIDIVIPVTDVTTYLVARNATRLGAAAAAPPFEAFDFVSDKWRLLLHARACGMAVP